MESLIGLSEASERELAAVGGGCGEPNAQDINRMLQDGLRQLLMDISSLNTHPEDAPPPPWVTGGAIT